MHYSCGARNGDESHSSCECFFAIIRIHRVHSFSKRSKYANQMNYLSIEMSFDAAAIRYQIVINPRSKFACCICNYMTILLKWDFVVKDLLLLHFYFLFRFKYKSTGVFFAPTTILMDLMCFSSPSFIALIINCSNLTFVFFRDFTRNCQTGILNVECRNGAKLNNWWQWFKVDDL